MKNRTEELMKIVWEKNGYSDMYYLGYTDCIKQLIEAIGDNSYIDKESLLYILETQSNHHSSFVKDIVNEYIEKHDYDWGRYKHTPLFNIGDQFHINYYRPSIDGETVDSIYGNYFITKIYKKRYKEGVYYKLSSPAKNNGISDVVVMENVLINSHKGWL